MKRNHWIGLLAVVAVLGLVGYYFASPLIAFQSLRSALQAGDRDRIESLVDFPSVRESLKAQVKLQVVDALQQDPEMRNNPFAALALMMAPALVDQVVDVAVTPEGIPSLVEQGRLQTPEQAKAASRPARPASKPARLGYAGLDVFKAEIPAAEGQGVVSIVMRREGLFGWKVKRIDLPKDLFEGLSRPGPAAAPPPAS